MTGGAGLVAAGQKGLGLGVLTVGLIGYAAGGPIVHFTHRRVGPGFGSLALRVGTPLLGGTVGRPPVGTARSVAR